VSRFLPAVDVLLYVVVEETQNDVMNKKDLYSGKLFPHNGCENDKGWVVFVEETVKYDTDERHTEKECFLEMDLGLSWWHISQLGCCL